MLSVPKPQRPLAFLTIRASKVSSPSSGTNRMKGFPGTGTPRQVLRSRSMCQTSRHWPRLSGFRLRREMAKMRTRMTRRESHRRPPSRSSRIRRLMEVKEALSIVTVGIQNRTKMKITIKILLSKISLFLLLVCWIFDMEIKGLQPRLKPNFESYLKINSIHFGI